MPTVQLTKNSFKNVVQKTGIVVLDWWAPWCGPCRAFAPAFEAASTRHPDITWAKVNTEQEPELAGFFRIQAIPTLMAFRDGILLFEQAGMLPPAALDKLAEQLRSIDMNEVRRKAQPRDVAVSPPRG